MGIAAIALVVLWDAPTTKPMPALGVGIAYLALRAPPGSGSSGIPNGATKSAPIYVANALAVGAGAAWSGARQPGLWAAPHPHIVGVSGPGWSPLCHDPWVPSTRLLVYWLALLSPVSRPERPGRCPAR